MRYFTNNPLERLMMQKPKAAREDSPPDAAKRDFHERWSRLTKEQQSLVFRKVKGETNVAIAAEQGVSEAAIRKQLKRIQKHFIDIH